MSATESAKTEKTAAAAKPEKGVQVHGTINADLHRGLEEYRWDVRKTSTEIVVAAIEEYAANHGVKPLTVDELAKLEAARNAPVKAS